MKVILTEKVLSLGNVGEIVAVSPGFGRNFLIPQGKAVLANEGSEKQLAHHKKALAKKVADEKSAAQDLKGKLDGLTLELIKKVGGSGKLFGTVTSSEISKILSGKGLEVEKRIINIPVSIKALGTFDVKAKLFTDVEAEFKVKVEIDPTQAEELKKKAEAAAAAKKAAEEEKKAAEESGETEAEEPVAELTEEQKLKAEADRLLRS